MNIYNHARTYIHIYTYKSSQTQLHSHSTQQYYQHADMCGFLT